MADWPGRIFHLFSLTGERGKSDMVKEVIALVAHMRWIIKHSNKSFHIRINVTLMAVMNDVAKSN
jgi:hypothetical protein